VIDQLSRQPIPYAVVRLNIRPALTAEPTTLFQSYQADDQGKFSFHFKAEKERQYELDGFVSGKYKPGNIIIINGGRKHQELKLELTPL
jgi:hypothetical protein